MISVYSPKETNFNTNGLVVLTDLISCSVEDTLNGSYELTIEHTIDERGKWEYLLEDYIIKCDGQLFRIYSKNKTILGIKIFCRHIFYDLLDNFIEDVRPTNTNGDTALKSALASTQYVHPFTGSSDIATLSTTYIMGKNPVEGIVGTGGLLENYGGELKRDNFDIKILTAIGEDNGVLVAYGKNIQAIEENLDNSTLCTRLKVTGICANGFTIGLPETYVDSPLIDLYSHPKINETQFGADVMPISLDNITSAVTTAIATYKAKSVVNNASYSGDIASTQVISTICSKEAITIAEKVTLKSEWDKIVAEKPTHDASATQYLVSPTATYANLDALKTAIPKGNANIYACTNDDSNNGLKWYYWSTFEWKETAVTPSQKTVYDTAYTSLSGYVTPILANMNAQYGISSVTMKAKFKAYFTARSALLTAVFNKTVDKLWLARCVANRDTYVVALRKLATDYFTRTQCDTGQPNYKIDMVALEKTVEYKNYAILQTVKLGDIVIVKHEKLNISLKSKVIKTTKNVLTDRIEKIELGTIKRTLNTNFNSTAQAIQQVVLRVGNLEGSTARVDNNGVIVNGTIDVSKIDNILAIYSAIADMDVKTDIYVDSLTTDLASIDTLLAGNIDATNIHANTIVAGSAIIAEGAIGSAQISDLDASKLDAGTVDTSKVTIQGANGRLKIANNRLQVFEYPNHDLAQPLFERVALGNLEGDLYGLRIRGIDGTTLMIDENGVHNAGITDKAVTDPKISEGANINGSKLDIGSVITSINADGTQTIQGSKIFIDNSTLDIEFSTLTSSAGDSVSRLDSAESGIAQNAEAIGLNVSSTDFNALSGLVDAHETAIGLVDDKISFAVSEVQSTVDDNGIAIEEMKSYIDFTVDGLVLGKDGGENDNLKVKITNEDMQFLDNGVKVAYISNQQMEIDKAKILTSIIVGNHIIEKYNTEITLIKWIG